MDELNNCEMVQKSAKFSKLARLEGNDILKKSFHSKGEHVKILSLYSKSIAYAPSNSEELALGYSNRSFFLIHLKMYQFSITDIDRALKIAKTNVLRAKIICRKIAAIRSMNKQITESIIDEAKGAIAAIDISDLKIKVQLEELLKKAINQDSNPDKCVFEQADLPKIDADIELPATSNAIHMEYNKEHGRHYRATRNISPGEILIIEQGYVAVPKKEHFYVTCSMCLKIAWAGIPCNNCPYVIYCSEECKETAWNLFHTLECPILGRVFNEISISPTIFLTLRMLMKGLKKDSNLDFNHLLKEFFFAKNNTDERSKGFQNGRFSSESIRSIFSLTSYFKVCKNALIDPSLGKLISVLQAEFGQLFYSSQVHKSLQSFNINSFIDFVIYLFCLIEINVDMYIGHNCSCDCMSVLSREHKNDCLIDIGRIIGASQSLVNHSCVPNTSKIFKDGKIILLATVPIKKNEQIFHSHGPTFVDPLQVRQEYLLNNYHFTCHCVSCEEDWNIDSQAQSDKAISSYGAAFLVKMGSISALLEHNRELLFSADVKEIIDELKLKINRIYKSNSLYNASLIANFIPDPLPAFYEAYYGGHTYIPEDNKNL